MQKAVIFDMDGTLFQTKLVLHKALEKAFKKLRKEKLWTGDTPLKQYEAIMGVPLVEVWLTLCPNLNEQQRTDINQYFTQQLITLIADGEGALYPHTEQVLATLAETHPLFIASNGEIDYINAIMKYYKLDRFIEQSYSIQMISSSNKAQLVQLIKEEHHIAAGYMVGDRISDFDAAKENDLTAIGVTFDFSLEEELQQADYCIDALPQLLTLVQ